MSEFEDKVVRFKELARQLSPEVKDLIEGLTEENEAETLKSLLALTASDPDLSKKIQEAAVIAFAELGDLNPDEIARKSEEAQRQALAIQQSPGWVSLLSELNFKEEDLLFQTQENAPLQLHPVIAALIGERLQFDGDIPELRSGDLPFGAEPAVPVSNPATNPVALGFQLQAASKAVTEELVKAQQERAENLSLLASEIEGGSSTALTVAARKELDRLADQPLQVEGYKPGQKALARSSDLPSASQMLALSPLEKQKLFFKALTSTQGRDSAVPVIAALIRKTLEAKGFEVQIGVVDAKEPSALRSLWKCQMDSGAADSNSRFSFLDVAASCLARDLASKSKSAKLVVQVQGYADVPKRFMGWKAFAKEV